MKELAKKYSSGMRILEDLLNKKYYAREGIFRFNQSYEFYTKMREEFLKEVFMAGYKRGYEKGLREKEVL